MVRAEIGVVYAQRGYAELYHGIQTLLAQETHPALTSKLFLVWSSNPSPKWHELEEPGGCVCVGKVHTAGRIFLLTLISPASQTSSLTNWPFPFHFQGVGPWPSVVMPTHLSAEPFVEQELLRLKEEEILQRCEGANSDGS